MKINFKGVFVLTVITTVVALLMAITNFLTAPIIKISEDKAVNESLLVVMPDGKSFNKLEISSYPMPSTVNEVYASENGGYIVKSVASGYAERMTILCGIDAEGVITGALCISSSETLGYEKSYGTNLVGSTIDTIDSVDTISGATLTTEGYKNAIKDSFAAVSILKGVNLT